MRRTLSLDLRERILSSYDNDEGTREEIARRFRVSLGMVKKLLQQRRHTGDIAPQHHRAGRKPMIVAAHQRQLRGLLAKKTDLTLKEMRAALSLECSLQAIHTVLDKMGLTLKKRRLGPANKTGPTSHGRGAHGGGARQASIRHGSSSSTSRGPKQT
jgi:transposase